MKYKLGAAVAVVSLMCAPAIVVAGNTSWAVVVDATYDDQDAQVISALDHSWTQVQLIHDALTNHALIDTTNYLPPDPCKRIADKWNHTVAHHPTKLTKFEHLVERMARKNCKITFVPGTTNGNGSTALNEVAPTP